MLGSFFCFALSLRQVNKSYALSYTVTYGNWWMRRFPKKVKHIKKAVYKCKGLTNLLTKM